MGKEYVLRTENLTKAFGQHKAVNNVSMTVRKGDIYGFIGKNGAGKTTFMKMIAGLSNPTQGMIELFGRKEVHRSNRKNIDLFGKTEVELQRRRIGCLIEDTGFYSGMTAAENIEIVRRSLGITDKSVALEMLDFVGLADAGRKKLKHFSMGMKQRLGLAISLMRNPDFLILDEPINGLDPTGIKEIRDLLVKLNQEKQITILISSHILGELSKVATRYGIIRDGTLIEEFDAQELEDRCKRCQKLIVDDAAAAVRILEENLGIRNYDVPEEHMVRIFGETEQSANIHKALILGGVQLIESTMSGQDLEGYFMELLSE